MLMSIQEYQIRMSLKNLIPCKHFQLQTRALKLLTLIQGLVHVIFLGIVEQDFNYFFV
jgi:hypothetical protein